MTQTPVDASVSARIIYGMVSVANLQRMRITSIDLEHIIRDANGYMAIKNYNNIFKVVDCLGTLNELDVPDETEAIVPRTTICLRRHRDHQLYMIRSYSLHNHEVTSYDTTNNAVLRKDMMKTYIEFVHLVFHYVLQGFSIKSNEDCRTVQTAPLQQTTTRLTTHI
jgi:hypothetical protein